MSETITNAVKGKYGSVAASGLSSDHAGVRAVAEAFGYSPEELASIPAEANMGLSCGNPTATAKLREGETVVDLGSGGGLDVLLAARKVGPSGRAIGVDMTPEMIDLSRRNAEKSGLANVEFHLAPIDRLPLPDASADCVISNCVINLAPDKAAVFREIARVLKPGGRLAVSDIALKCELPPELGNDLMAYVGCIAGAIPIEEYGKGLVEAGFAHVEVIDGGADLNAYAKVENQAGCCPLPGEPSGLPIADSGCCAVGPAAVVDEALHARLADLLRRYDVNDYAAGVKVFAVKPGAIPNRPPAKEPVPVADAAEPVKLLSGGNPQIAKADGDAPVQAYIAAMPGWKSDLGRRLDEIIVRIVPDVRKAVRWNSPFYGVEGQGWFLSFHVLTRYVKVTFFQGLSLHPVPPGGTPKSKDARWIDIYEGDQLDEARMASWVKQAAALPGWIP